MLKSLSKSLVLAVGFVAALAFSASASPITYTYVGNDGFSGFFTINTSDFTSSMAGFQVPNTAITAFSFSGDGVTFNLADTSVGDASGASIVFDTTVNPPVVTDGAGGSLACDAAGDCVGIYGTDVDISLASGGGEDSTGSWVVESSAMPEPATLVLLGAGLLGIRFRQRRKLA